MTESFPPAVFTHCGKSASPSCSMLMGEVGKDILIFGVFFLRFALVTVEYCLIGLAIYNCTGSKLLSVRIVPGFFHVAFSFVMRFGGSVWKYMNGMETCLSIFFGGLLLYSLSRRSDGPTG